MLFMFGSRMSGKRRRRSAGGNRPDRRRSAAGIGISAGVRGRPARGT
ncbi:hypothetical protein BURPSS13_C0014 [Burkholderia pseudomallei S13]|nr:hypothetical protein BURPSS13_C0014 [Burkholderia pseudomallei S13]